VTLSAERVANIRAQLHDLPAKLSDYYRFTTYAEAMANFLGPVWKSRSPADTKTYALVREHRAATS
jgi:hypothetical protein